MNIVIAAIQNLENDANGVATHARDLKKGLLENGHQVAFITPYIMLGTSWWSYWRKLNIRPGQGLKTLLNLCWNCLKLWRNLRIHTSNTEIVNAQDVIAAGVTLLALRGATPVVLTCHFWNPPWDEFVDGRYVKKGSLPYLCLKYLFRYIMNHPRLYLVAVSRRNDRLLAQISAAEQDRRRIIYNGIPEAAVAEQFPNNDPYILNVGRLDPRKNQRFLIDIAAALQAKGEKLRFVIAGPEDSRERIHFEKLARKKNVWESFQLTGVLSREETLKLMAGAALYFHTARAESFGMVMLEAISVGTPVLALYCEVLEEVLAARETVVFSGEESPEAIATQITYLLKDESALKKILTVQRAHFKNHFTGKRMVENYLNFFQGCITQTIYPGS